MFHTWGWFSYTFLLRKEVSVACRLEFPLITEEMSNVLHNRMLRAWSAVLPCCWVNLVVKVLLGQVIFLLCRGHMLVVGYRF